MQRRIVLSGVLAPRAMERLRPLEDAGFELVDRTSLDGEEDAGVVAEGVRGAWATIAGNERYTGSVFAAAADLRAIARWGIGFDAIDVDAATQAGVAVLTAPGANSDSVADCALSLMLACVRRLPAADAAVRSGLWREPELAGDLTGATVGIVGLGAVGRAVARRLAGFGCRMLAVEPAPNEAFCRELGVELVSLDQLLPSVDVLSLHLPLGGPTEHLIGERELATMRPGAILVNTSRGPVVDEAALVRALASGHLGGAGLDVFESEPLDPASPLTSLPNVVLSGHAATFTRLAVDRTADSVVASLLEAAAGRLGPGCINPQAWARS